MNGFAQTAAKQLKVNLRRVGSVGDNETKHNKSFDCFAFLMRRKIIIAVITFVAVLVLGSYIYLSAAVGRCLNPSQFVRFSTTIAMAVIHPNEGGAARAFSLYRQA